MNTDRRNLYGQLAPSQTGGGGGGSYILPQATENMLGGIKAKQRTTETVEAAVDKETGKMYVPTYPESGGGEPYELPVMSQTQLGGGKAVPKTTETVPVAVGEDGQLFVPEQSGSGSSGYVPPNKVSHGTADTTFNLPPNEEHGWDEITELNLTLQEGEEGKSNIYCVSFTSGSTATRLSITPTATLTKDIEPNGKYTIVILNGIAAVGRGEL